MRYLFTHTSHPESPKYFTSASNKEAPQFTILHNGKPFIRYTAVNTTYTYILGFHRFCHR